MYQFSYSEVFDESPQVMRSRERDAMDRVIDMLKDAQRLGPASKERIEAFYYLQRLWAIFGEDLRNPDNGLPDQLRNNLLSISAWIHREIDRLRGGETADMSPLIEINQIVRDGLK